MDAALISLALSGCSDEPREVEVPVERLSSTDAQRRGRAVFLQRCAICHGVKADGHGIRKVGLSGPPRNFRDPSWRESAEPRHLFQVISEGIPGTSMAAWPILSVDQRWDVIAYILSVAEEGQ